MIDFDALEIYLGVAMVTVGFTKLAKDRGDSLGIVFAIAGINSLLDGGKAIWGNQMDKPTLGIAFGEMVTVIAGLTVMRAARMEPESKAVVTAALVAGYTKLTMPKITDGNLFFKSMISGTVIYVIQSLE